MSIVSRTTLKGYFDTGDTITSGAMNDLIDSMVNRADTTAQSLQSELVLPSFVASNVSAQQVNVVGNLTASAATFTGRLRQGVSAAASAADTRGDVLVCQESTVAGGATAQVANLPDCNIVGFGLKVLVGGSAATGGIQFNVGRSGNRNYYGFQAVSATGLFQMTDVSAARLTGTSGAIEVVMSGASANTNAIFVTRYYQRA